MALFRFYSRALARQLDDKFYSEVNFFKRGAQADLRDQVEFDFLNGFMYRNRGQYDKARQRYLAVLQHRPNHASAMREIVSALRGMEDYESAYSYAKKNYERDSENPYHIQSYFDILIRRVPKLLDSEKKQLAEMRITIERINGSKPLNAYYEIEALYAMYIEADKEKTVAILKNGCRSFPGSFYIVRLLFDCYDHFGDIRGMESILPELQALGNKNERFKSGVALRDAILDAYHGVAEDIIFSKIASISGFSDDAKYRLKNKVHKIRESILSAYCSRRSIRLSLILPASMGQKEAIKTAARKRRCFVPTCSMCLKPPRHQAGRDSS